jgi:hypothetical protein
LADHFGSVPPRDETCTLGPEPSYGRTHASSAPVMLETYASHAPSAGSGQAFAESGHRPVWHAGWDGTMDSRAGSFPLAC